MFQQLHSLALVVPQQGCVVQKALLSDGLCIAAKLHVSKTVVCKSAQTWLRRHVCFRHKGPQRLSTCHSVLLA